LNPALSTACRRVLPPVKPNTGFGQVNFESIRASCAAVDNEVLSDLAQACWPGVEILAERPLTGDAGTRRYVRLHLRGANAPETALAMVFAADGSARAPEEGDGPSQNELPFVNVQRFLKGHEIPVPEIYWVAEAAGCLLLEDLGDLPLAQAAENADDSVRKDLMSRAVSLLARLATVDSRAHSSCFALEQTYGAPAIARELEITATHGLGHAQGIGIRPVGADPALENALAALGQRIAAQPVGLMHRDYHAWNLHLDPADRLCLIDFQDATRGPLLYDLASLLTDRDTDRFVSPELESHLVALWRREMDRYGCQVYPDDEALTDAYFTAVAYRTLRVIGRFGVLALELDKPGYFERYAPRMAQHTMRALDKLGEEDLADLLFQRSPIFS
jgi:aminoglycoside/choline kinase family phosphotransferase